MHLPMIKRAFATNPAVKIVPIIVGSLTFDQEQEYAALLGSYMRQDSTLFIISSDFCHWGKDFDYTPYENLERGA